MPGDITNDGDRKRILAAAVDHGDGLDALINNAGNMYRGAISELQEQDLADIFNSNVIAAMLLTGLAVPHLEQRGGAVLFVGSIHTRRAFPGVSPCSDQGCRPGADQGAGSRIGGKNSG